MNNYSENHQPVVYYLASKSNPEIIKIGTTINMAKRLPRLKKIRPTWDVYFYAIEPGTYGLEEQRFTEFEHLRVGHDWYLFKDELAAHVSTCEVLEK